MRVMMLYISRAAPPHDRRVAITSFDQQAYLIGRRAAELLVSRIEKGPWKRRPKAKTLPNRPCLVEGTSCAIPTSFLNPD